MKASEIIIGQDYAIERFGGSYYRARVVDIGDVEHGGRYSFSKSTVTKRATVMFLRSDGTDVGPNTETVALNKVASTWADHLVAQARRRSDSASVDERLGAIEDRCHALLGEDHMVYFSRRNTNYQSVGTATVSSSTMTKLLDAAFKAGVESGAGLSPGSFK